MKKSALPPRRSDTFADVHATNPYLALLDIRRPVPNTYDPDWCRWVNLVFAWSAAAFEVIEANNALIDAYEQWSERGSALKHEAEVYRRMERIEGYNPARLAELNAKIAAMRTADWHTKPSERIAAAEENLRLVEAHLDGLMEQHGLYEKQVE